MKKGILILGFGLLLTACASPTFQMSPEQVASLSDDQLCSYQNNYRDETKLLDEISHRKLNCDRFYRECLRQGNTPGTQAMGFCIATLRENERLQYERESWRNDINVYNTFPHHHIH